VKRELASLIILKPFIGKFEHTTYTLAKYTTPDIIMTDINITQSNTMILTNNKSMTDDKFVDEVEEGVITAFNKTTMPPPKTTRLSVVSQKYDINKDGVLDEAELASTL
jgi:hypothetical protein